MKQLTASAVAALAIAVLNPALANAQVNRTFVSGHGSDSNDCSFGSPCRSFAAALLVTNPKGEIVVLDPAGYGTVTITKSVSIVNDGVGDATITDAASLTSAVTIAAGASDVVNLRGLILNGVNGGNTGILFTTGAALNIQNCTIQGFTSQGIAFTPTMSSTLTVFDTVVSDIGGTTAAVLIEPQGSGLTVNAYLGRVQVNGNGQHGIDVNTAGMTGGGLQATVVDSVVTGNPNGAGVLIPTLSTPTVILINTRLINNQVGLNAGGGTTYLAETTISGNSGDGFIVRPGAVVNTFGNNRITDATNVGSLTAFAKQ